MEYFKDMQLNLKYLSCYLGVAASHGYLGSVAVAFSTSLLFAETLSRPSSNPFIISSTALTLPLSICCVPSAAHQPCLIMTYHLSHTLQSPIFMVVLLWISSLSLSLAVLQFLATSAPVPALLGCRVWCVFFPLPVIPFICSSPVMPDRYDR